MMTSSTICLASMTEASLHVAIHAGFYLRAGGGGGYVSPPERLKKYIIMCCTGKALAN